MYDDLHKLQEVITIEMEIEISSVVLLAAAVKSAISNDPESRDSVRFRQFLTDNIKNRLTEIAEGFIEIAQQNMTE